MRCMRRGSVMWDIDFRPVFWFYGIVGFVIGVMSVLSIQFLSAHIYWR